MYVDLHTHSTASDGTMSPSEVVRLAKDSGLSAIALTDHDTVSGIAEACATAQTIGIDFLPGIEISAEFPPPGTLHILGYGIDPESAVLKEMTDSLLAGRDARNPKIVAKLNQLGITISMNEVEAEAGGDVIGRPHIAAVLVKKGYVSSVKQAFDQYLAQGAAAYFDKERLTPRRAIDLIHQSGGLAVLAHPIQLRLENDAQLHRVIKDLVDVGLDGIEVIHSDHNEDLIKKYSDIARQYNLLPTGGSDFHGLNKSDICIGFAGRKRVPRAFFEAIIQKLGRNV